MIHEQPSDLVEVTLSVCTTITVHTSFIAYHRWKDCPHPEKAFLRDFHRHVFHVHAEITVTHADRDLEFFMVQDLLTSLCRNFEGRQLDNSCESFAQILLLGLLRHGLPCYQVQVSEDEENSATVSVLSGELPLRKVTTLLPRSIAQSSVVTASASPALDGGRGE